MITNTCQKPSDLEIIMGFKNGDPQMTAEFYRRFKKYINFGIYKKYKLAREAEDAAQEINLYLLKRANKFNPAIGTLQTFVYMAIRNVCCKFIDKNKRQLPTKRINPNRIPAICTQLDFPSEIAQLRANLERHILPTDPYRLHHDFGMTIRQVSVAKGVPEKKVNSHTTGHGQKLRRLLPNVRAA